MAVDGPETRRARVCPAGGRRCAATPRDQESVCFTERVVCAIFRARAIVRARRQACASSSGGGWAPGVATPESRNVGPASPVGGAGPSFV
jgi:hypothetical protein